MTGFKMIALRDAGLLGATLIGWLGLLELSVGEGYLAEFIGVTLGLGIGVSAWVIHEWGHWLAAKAMGADLRAATKLTSIYLFGFDNKINSKAQFIVMALGGFVATACVIAFVLMVLPSEFLATKVARGVVFLELALTVSLEVPGLIFGIVAYDKLPSVDVLGE